jgi:hypothetical protein
MADIRFTGNTALAFVRARAKLVGAINLLDLVGFQVSSQLCTKLTDSSAIVADRLPVGDDFEKVSVFRA